ncbi:MAG: WG repeat-containing protein [Clostridia bacterium]|nr:WG repeat-containing protein [Clostridia bacterium]
MKKRILYAMNTAVVRVVSLALLAMLTLAAALYQKGYYDFTFIERVPLPGYGADDTPDSPVTPETEQTPDTEEIPSIGTGDVGQTDSPAPDDPTTPPTNPSNPGTTQTTTSKKAADVIAGLTSTRSALSAGYTMQTGGTFQKGKWVFTDLGIKGFSDQYSLSEYQRRTVMTTEYERGCIVQSPTTETAKRPAVMLKNGLIIKDNGKGSLEVLRLDGTVMLKDYDESTFYLTDLRDAEGHVLFCAPKIEKETVFLPIMQPNEYSGIPEETGFYEEEETEVEYVVNTYWYLSADNKWVVSSYTDENPPVELNKGLSFDAPSDYGESDCDIERFYAYGSWGFRSKSTGQTLLSPRYRMAYNFHDGYAIVLDYYQMHIIDKNFRDVYVSGFEYPETFVTFNELTMPDTNGIENLGTYYVSHGLTRVRYRRNLSTYKVYNYIKTDDYSTLIDLSGKEFPFPTGYSMISYSDGVILLKKDGEELYGYMNYKGEWIAQPMYTYARPFISGLGVLGYANGKKGIIDVSGSWVLPMSFEAVSDVSMGGVTVFDRTTGWHVLQCAAK